MIIEKEINSINDLITFSFPQSCFDASIQRTMLKYVFRGQSNVDYKLKSSLKRNSLGNEAIAEQRLLQNFKKYGQTVEPLITHSIWETLVIAQHHGLPTRLLDWTYSPLVALHFALAQVDTGAKLDTDAAVWAVDLKSMNAQLPDEYRRLIDENNVMAFTLDMLKELNLTLQSYNQDMGNKSVLFFEPPSIDSRIVNQYAILSINSASLDPLDLLFDTQNSEGPDVFKLIIPNGCSRKMVDELQIMGINERVLFPGLDGLASWLKRYYYHRPKDL